MITLTLNEYKIQMISNEDSYPDKSFVYDYIYKDYNLSTIYTNKSISIYLFKNGIQIKSTLLVGAGGTGIFSKNSALIKKSKLFICLTNNIFCISSLDLSLIWVTNIEWSNCFQIFALDEGLIIHGEQTITKINECGCILWQFRGDDIFVNSNVEFTFQIGGGKIKTSDYKGNYYELDFAGNLLLKLP